MFQGGVSFSVKGDGWWGEGNCSEEGIVWRRDSFKKGSFKGIVIKAIE